VTDRADQTRKSVAAFIAHLRSQGHTYEADTIERQTKLPPPVDPLDSIERKVRHLTWLLAATMVGVFAILLKVLML
jgi:hypothetical protein